MDKQERITECEENIKLYLNESETWQSKLDILNSLTFTTAPLHVLIGVENELEESNKDLAYWEAELAKAQAMPDEPNNKPKHSHTTILAEHKTVLKVRAIKAYREETGATLDEAYNYNFPKHTCNEAPPQLDAETFLSQQMNGRKEQNRIYESFDGGAVLEVNNNQVNLTLNTDGTYEIDGYSFRFKDGLNAGIFFNLGNFISGIGLQWQAAVAASKEATS